MTVERTEPPEAGGNGGPAATDSGNAAAAAAGDAAGIGQEARAEQPEELVGRVQDPKEGSAGAYEGGWEEEERDDGDEAGPRTTVAQGDNSVVTEKEGAGTGAESGNAGQAEEGGEEDVGEPAGEPQVAAALESVRLGLVGVEGAVFELGTELGAALKELAEVKGKLGAVGALGEKDGGADLKPVAAGVAKVSEDIVQLVELAREQGELLKQAGKGQGESGEEDLLSKLQGMLKAGLDRVDERIEGLVEAGNKQSEAFEGVKLDVKVVKEVGASVGTLEERLQAYKEDLSRDREMMGGPRRWAVLAVVVVAAPALLVAGAFVEGQWEVLPLQESTGGWKDHVWERYGLDLVECVKTGVRQGAPYDCTVDVGASVEQVRRASGR